MCFSLKDFDSLKIDDVEASVASDSCEELPDDVFSKPLVLAKGESASSYNCCCAETLHCVTLHRNLYYDIVDLSVNMVE